MRYWILAFTLTLCFKADAQDSIDIALDSIVVELLFDTIPEFSFFNPNEITKHQSRLAALHSSSNAQAIYFWILMGFSVVLTWLFLNSRELVKSSVKSIRSLQHTIHFSRADKQTNIFYFVLYAFLFLIGFSLLIHFISNELYQANFSVLSLTILVFSAFIMDYLFTYFYFLFTKGSRTVELVQAVVLNYAIILCLVLCPLLFFIVLASLGVAKIFSIILLGIIAIILLIKEIRVLQVLWIEKINIVSIHFFAYLCTFKFLPILFLIKIVLS